MRDMRNVIISETHDCIHARGDFCLSDVMQGARRELYVVKPETSGREEYILLVLIRKYLQKIFLLIFCIILRLSHRFL